MKTFNELVLDTIREKGPQTSGQLAQILGKESWKICILLRNLRLRGGITREFTHATCGKNKNQRTALWSLPKSKSKSSVQTKTFADWWSEEVNTYFHGNTDCDSIRTGAEKVWDGSRAAVVEFLEAKMAELKGMTLYHPEHTIATWIAELKGDVE
jgi:hypothetical protein